MSELYTGPTADRAPAVRAYSAEELRGLATLVDEMPAPLEFQPRVVVLGTHTRHGDDETFGELHWLEQAHEWRFVPREVELVSSILTEWEPAPGQSYPEGSDV